MAKKPCGVTYNGKEFTRDQFMAYLLQNKTLDNYVYGAPAGAVRPVSVKDVQRINYTTQNGNQRVMYDNGALKVVNAKTGEEVSAPTKRRAIREAVDQYDFTKGNTATEVPADATTDKEVGMHIVNTSNNPAEIVSLWQMQEPVPEALSSVESAIAEFGQFTTTNNSYNRFGDRNNMSRGKALSYVNNAKGAGIDQIAKEISDHTGVDVQPQDIVDFMDRFPGGVQQAMRPKPTEVANEAAAKFEQLTGFPLTKDIAEKVMAQFEAKMDEQSRKAYDEALQKEYDNEQQLTAELDRLIAEGAIKLPEEGVNNVSKENSGNEPLDQQTETGQNEPRQEPAAANEAIPVKEVSPEEKQLRTVIDKISDLQLKMEKADAAKEALRKQGKENSDEFKIKYKAWQQLNAKMREAEKEFKVLSAKIWADKLRQGKIKNTGLAMSNPFQIPVAIYNAAIETAASALEAGAHIANAIQSAVDYVNDRVFTRWDEEKFRDKLGQNIAFPLTPEQLREAKVNDTELSVKNRQIADALVDEVKNGRADKAQVVEQINTSKLSPAIKEKITQYINKNITENVYKLQGKDLAEKYISQYPDDYEAAREEMGKEYDTTLANTTDPAQIDNLRNVFMAANAYMDTKETEEKVRSGEIKPVSTIQKAPEGQYTFQLPRVTTSRKANQNFADKYARIEEAQKEAKQITEQTDALSAYRLMKPRAWAKINEIRDWLGSNGIHKDSFYGRMKQAGVDLQKFNLYLYAKHAIERNDANARDRELAFNNRNLYLRQRIANAATDATRIKYQQQLDELNNQRNPDYVLMPDGGSGMTNKEAQDILDEVEKDGKTAEYEQFAKEFRENVVDKILDFKYESGIIDQEQYNRIRAAYSNYVPLKFDIETARRLMDGEDGRTPEERAEDDKLNKERKTGKDLYRSKGAADVKWTDRNSPILQSVKDLEYSILRGEENIANIRMANLVRENPNPEIWDVRNAQYDIDTDKEGNVIHSEEVRAPKDAIPFWEDGNKKYIVLHDQQLKDTFKRIGTSKVLRGLQNVTAFTRFFATLTNVSFLAINPIIDAQDAAIYLTDAGGPELTKTFAKNVAKGWLPAVRDLFRGEGEYHDLMKDWESAGGKVSFSKPMGLEEEANKISKLYNDYGKTLTSSQWKTVKDYVQNKLEILETVTRLLVYKSALETGMPKEKAALLSRDATVDFEKSGIYGQYINAWKAFANAAIQGTVGTFKIAKNKYVQRAIGLTVGFGFLQALMADMLSDCEKNPENCYWEMPEWRKEKNYVIPTGQGAPLTFPASRRLGWLNYVGQGLYSMMKYAQTDGKYGIDPSEFAANVTSSFFDYYDPSGQVQHMDLNSVEGLGGSLIRMGSGNFAPLYELKVNENNFGAPIKPQNYDHRPQHLLYNKNTPKIWVDAANAISRFGGGGGGKNASSEKFEISPATMEFIMQSAFTGAYSFIEGTAKTAAAAANPNAKTAAKDIPIVNRFVRESNMSVTKDKKAELIDKATKHILTDKENKQLHDYLDDLVEGGQDPEGKGKVSALRFVNKSQRQLMKNEHKYKEE